MKHKFEFDTTEAILICKALGMDMFNWVENDIAEKMREKIQEVVKKDLTKKETDLTDKCGSCKWSRVKRGTYIDCICPSKTPNFFARTQKKCRFYEMEKSNEV